jgi:hypothetical protein
MLPLHRHAYRGVMARRFSGGPATAAECSAPLLEQGGFVLVRGGGRRWVQAVQMRAGKAQVS